jgi:hypothetical protein
MRAMPPAAADPVRKAVRNVQKVVNGGNAFILRRAIKKGEDALGHFCQHAVIG